MANHASAKSATTATTSGSAQSQNAYIKRARCRVEKKLWNCIALNEDVHAAFDALAESYRQPAAGRIPALVLLNQISLAYFNNCTDPSPPVAVLFSWDAATHDYLRGFSEPYSPGPGWVSSASTVDQLLDTIRDLTERPKEQTKGSRDCSEFLSAGECRFQPADGGQLGYVDWYISTIQQCRPDLSESHGILIFDGSMRLSSFNAGGITESGIIPLKTLDAWIAHVVMVYDSIWERDDRFTYLGPGEHTARWAFQPDAEDDSTGTICLEPFFSSPSVGRRTWAAFSRRRNADEGLRRDETDAEGFFKMSWQLERGESERSEGQLLDRAHAESWLPGLVRHWGHWQGDESGTRVYHNRRRRIKEMLHIASVGQPMSRCRSVEHVLKVVFDGTRVVQELDKRGILHRDVSLNNVLCFPKHDPRLLDAHPEKAVASVRDVPCIDYVLTGDETREPCVLITDLDLSAVSRSEAGKPFPTVARRVGTPKFFSVEACSLTPEPLLPLDRLALNELLEKLRVLDASPMQRGRMFPNGEDEGFIDMVTHIFNLEVARGTPGTTSPVVVGHLPRHDVETLFWDLFWALARACPLGGDPDIDVGEEFHEFVTAMLEHDFGKETRRPYFTVARFENVLHPGLRRFAPLLTNILRYLSIPWHLYDADPDVDEHLRRYHANIAMQRLLFAEIDEIRSHCLDVLLDTEQPRRGTLGEDVFFAASVASGEETETTVAAASTVGSQASTPTAAPSTPADLSGQSSDVPRATHESETQLKRKRADRDESDDEDCRLSLKRQKADRPAGRSRLSYYISDLAEFFRRDRRSWFGGTTETILEAKDTWKYNYRRRQKRKDN